MCIRDRQSNIIVELLNYCTWSRQEFSILYTLPSQKILRKTLLYNYPRQQRTSYGMFVLAPICHRFFCICSRSYRPEYNIHHNHNQCNCGHGYPKADIKTQPFGGSEKSHPNFLPIHHYTSLEQFAIVTDIGFFQAGCQHHIQQDAGNQISKVCYRQSDKSQHRSKGCKGNNG